MEIPRLPERAGTKRQKLSKQEEEFIHSDYSKRKSGKPPLILNFFAQSCVNTQTSASWSIPGDVSKDYKKLSYWTDMAKKAEAAKINAIFIADVLAAYDVYKGPGNYKIPVKAGVQIPGLDPSIPITAMAQVTESLGFGITFSTISEHPYHLARRLGSLDHLTGGRVGWNIVSSYLDSAARNLLSGAPLPKTADRYKRTEEYVQAIYELLLSSWRVDAVKADPETKTYADPELVRTIDFKGDYFDIPGPSYTEPSPQNIPVLFEAGTSKGGLELAAKHAEVLFINGRNTDIIRDKVIGVKEIAVGKYKRDPNHVKVIALVMVITGKTHEEAQAKYDEYSKYVDPEGALALVGGWTGCDFSQFPEDTDLRHVDNVIAKTIVELYAPTLVGPITREKLGRHLAVKGSAELILGSHDEVIATLEEWADAGLDGFNFATAVNPDTYTDLCEIIVPELRKRGLAWDDYPVPGGTFRENIYGVKGHTFVPEDHVAYGYRWAKGTNEEFTEHLKKYKQDIKAKQQGANL